MLKYKLLWFSQWRKLPLRQLTDCVLVDGHEAQIIWLSWTWVDKEEVFVAPIPSHGSQKSLDDYHSQRLNGGTVSHEERGRCNYAIENNLYTTTVWLKADPPPPHHPMALPLRWGGGGGWRGYGLSTSVVLPLGIFSRIHVRDWAATGLGSNPLLTNIHWSWPGTRMGKRLDAASDHLREQSPARRNLGLHGYIPRFFNFTFSSGRTRNSIRAPPPWECKQAGAILRGRCERARIKRSRCVGLSFMKRAWQLLWKFFLRQRSLSQRLSNVSGLKMSTHSERALEIWRWPVETMISQNHCNWR